VKEEWARQPSPSPIRRVDLAGIAPAGAGRRHGVKRYQSGGDRRQGCRRSAFNIADRKGFNEISRTWAKAMVQAKVGLTNFGTAALVEPVSAAGVWLPKLQLWQF